MWFSAASAHKQILFVHMLRIWFGLFVFVSRPPRIWFDLICLYSARIWFDLICIRSFYLYLFVTLLSTRWQLISNGWAPLSLHPRHRRDHTADCVQSAHHTPAHFRGTNMVPSIVSVSPQQIATVFRDKTAGASDTEFWPRCCSPGLQHQ